MAVPSEKYFPATVSCQVHKIGSLIKDKLTKDQLQMFEKTIFGPLLNVNMVFNGQLIHHFLLRQIPEDGNADGICFSVLGSNEQQIIGAIRLISTKRTTLTPKGTKSNSG